MKAFVAVLFLLVLAGCSNPTSKSQQKPVQPLTSSTETYVLAEPVPGRNLKISISAKTKSLYIVNCNEFIVVALYKHGSNNPVWGGSSPACLSQSIIVPAKSTLSFIVPTGKNAPDLDTSTPYKAQVFHVLQGLDVKSPSVPLELVTSNEFKLIP